MRVRLFLVASALTALVGCGGSSSVSETTIAPVCGDKDAITVFAASSMLNIFNDIKSAYLVDHPCTSDITFSFGSSATLATQIVNGAPVDVFVSASTTTMATVQNAHLLKTSPVTFAKNTAEIMLYPGGHFSARISGVGDLVDTKNPGIKVGVCVVSAPCGSLANTVLTKASLSRSTVIDSESPSVEDVVLKVELGELDAGIVYHSDCKNSVAGKKARCVEIPSSINSTNSYLAGSLNSKKNTTDFVAYLGSPQFQKYAHTKYGFLLP